MVNLGLNSLQTKRAYIYITFSTWSLFREMYNKPYNKTFIELALGPYGRILVSFFVYALHGPHGPC